MSWNKGGCGTVSQEAAREEEYKCVAMGRRAGSGRCRLGGRSSHGEN